VAYAPARRCSLPRSRWMPSRWMTCVRPRSSLPRGQVNPSTCAWSEPRRGVPTTGGRTCRAWHVGCCVRNPGATSPAGSSCARVLPARSPGPPAPGSSAHRARPPRVARAERLGGGRTHTLQASSARRPARSSLPRAMPGSPSARRDRGRRARAAWAAPAHAQAAPRRAAAAGSRARRASHVDLGEGEMQDLEHRPQAAGEFVAGDASWRDATRAAALKRLVCVPRSTALLCSART
jgi:hypothetical protein